MSTKDPDDYVRTVLLILATFCGGLLVMIVYGGNLAELFGRTTKEQGWFLIKLGGALVCAVLAHALVRRWFWACLLAGGSFSLIVQTISFLSTGHLDAFFLIALVVGSLLGFAVAAPVGLVFHLIRSSAKRP